MYVVAEEAIAVTHGTSHASTGMSWEPSAPRRVPDVHSFQPMGESGTPSGLQTHYVDCSGSAAAEGCDCLCRGVAADLYKPYIGGADRYLLVVTAQTVALKSERDDVDILRRRMDATSSWSRRWEEVGTPHKFQP